MKLKSLFFLIILLSCPLAVQANTYEAGRFRVQSILVADNGLYVRFSPAPVTCQGGERFRMHALVPNTQSNYSALTATLLTAYTTGETFSYIFFSGEGAPCSNSHALNLDMVELSIK